MGAFKIWTKVEDGSTLEVWLESNDQDWVGGARLVDDQGREEQWEHDKLFPGPKRKKLSVPRVYTVRVRIGFLGGKSTVDICAQILKADGQTLHGSPYRYAVSGKKGDIERATLIIATLKS